MEGHKLHSVMQLGTASSQSEWRKETVCSASLCCDRDRQLQKMPACFSPLSWLCRKKEREEGRRAFIELYRGHYTCKALSVGKGFVRTKDKPGDCNILVGGVVSCQNHEHLLLLKNSVIMET